MLPFAVGCLRTVSLGFVFYAVGMVLTQSFNGAEDTWTPTLINLGVFWLWRIRSRGGSPSTRVWPERRVHRVDGVLLDARGRQRGALPPRVMEGDRVGPVTERVAPGGLRSSSGTSLERRPLSPAGTSRCGHLEERRVIGGCTLFPRPQRSRHPFVDQDEEKTRNSWRFSISLRGCQEEGVGRDTATGRTMPASREL